MSHQPVGPAMAPSEAVSRRMIDETAVVLGDRRCGQFYRILRLKAPDLARLAHDLPGAFVMLDVADPAGGLFPLLRRPFTFLDVSDAEGWIDLLYQVVGQGTARMAAWPAGHAARVLGPLGNGFPTDPPAAALLVGGGVGLAPLFHLARVLRARDPKSRIELFAGGRAAAHLSFLDLFDGFVDAVHPATEDGSLGDQGFVTLPFSREARRARPGAVYYACGPERMLAAVQRVGREAGLAGYLSGESPMACGFGVCNGCVTRVRRGGEVTYSRMCVDGPVYPADELLLAADSGAPPERRGDNGLGHLPPT